jgi:hypothetical protein
MTTLKHLDDLEKKATQGEWSVEYDGPSRPILLSDKQMRSMSAFDGAGSRWGPYEAEDADLSFIAALVNFWRSEEGKQMRENADNAAYYKWKLKAIIPLFEEARDALPAISQVALRLYNLSPDLADRMDRAGTSTRADFDAARGEDK